ncbi:MAG: hypothetical protein AAF581_02420 [Planctomycetota bacterium]
MPRAIWMMIALLAVAWIQCLVVPATAVAQERPVSQQQPRSLYEFTVNLREDAQLRIQKHLRQLVASLGQRDVSHLTISQRMKRAALLARLDAYWRAGVFPQNRLFPGLRPVFIDAENRACAVADLMIHSGSGDLARRVAATQNYDYLPDIRVPGVAEWAALSGLTLDECAMIQPAYHCAVFSDSTCTQQGNDVAISWQTSYTPTGGFLFGAVSRNGANIFSWTGVDPGVYVDVNAPAGTHTYEIYWEESLTCFDTATCTVQVGNYLRGDVNGDNTLAPLVDLIHLLNWAFTGAAAPPCMAAADLDGDGSVSPIVDAVYFASYWYAGGPPPPEPFVSCGALPAAGGLDCLQLPLCP